MKLRIGTTPDADKLIAQIENWWRENRPSTASLVTDELERVLTFLAENPHAGRPYQRRGIPGLRMYRLKKTPYHVYYVPDLEHGELKVLALWSSMRKRGPPLKP